MSNLAKLIQVCKASVSLDVNEHKDLYMSAKDFLSQLFERQEMSPEDDINSDKFQKMIQTDTIICLTFYPHTPIGSYQIYHYDVEAAINEALSIVSK